MSIMAPGTYVTPASPVVVQQITRLNEHADELLQQTESAIDVLQSLSFSNTDLDPRFQFGEEDLEAVLNALGPLPGFDPGENWLNDFDLSAGNENFVYNPALAAALSEALPEFLVSAPPSAPPLPAAPGDPGDQPDVPLPERPVLDQYTAPNVDLSEEAPEYQDYTSEIPFPTLRPITLPTPPTLALDSIEFEGVTPEFRGTDPDAADFAFENGTYSDLMMARTKEAVLDMMDGNSGLPAAVEDALFERAREREVEASAREIMVAREEWASKGWRQPAGPLARREDRVRKDAGIKISAINRDQFIEHWRIQIEQFRQALASAVALEELSIRLFVTAEDRRFQAARMQMDLTLEVYNAQINRLNADAGVFQVQASVFRDRFQAEMSKVQVYAEELRARQIIGELNAQDVQIFAERLRALQINADVYRARIAGYAAKFEGVQAKVDVFRAQLESNKNLVGVYEADTRAFGEMVRAQLTREERFNVKATMYGKQIDAWKASYEGLLAGHNAELENAKLQRDVYEANTNRLQAFAQSEASRIQALVQKYQAIVAEIEAKSEAERTKYTLMLGIAQQAIERMKAAADILMKNGEINIQSGLTAANLMLRARETAATTLAQLAAGMTSAASVQAGISDSSSSSLSYNFNGELEVS